MGAASTSLQITIVTSVPGTGDEDYTLSAEIVGSDNGDTTEYLTGSSYYFRLFKSPNIASLVQNSNIGTVALSSSGISTTVPYEGDDPEYVVFSGSNSSNLEKVFEENLVYTPVGTIYDLDGNATDASLTATKGYTNIVASKEIYGVFEVTYTTKYDKYMFNSGVVGPMFIFFIGFSA